MDGAQSAEPTAGTGNEAATENPAAEEVETGEAAAAETGVEIGVVAAPPTETPTETATGTATATGAPPTSTTQVDATATAAPPPTETATATATATTAPVDPPTTDAATAIVPPPPPTSTEPVSGEATVAATATDSAATGDATATTATATGATATATGVAANGAPDITPPLPAPVPIVDDAPNGVRPHTPCQQHYQEPDKAEGTEDAEKEKEAEATTLEDGQPIENPGSPSPKENPGSPVSPKTPLSAIAPDSPKNRSQADLDALFGPSSDEEQEEEEEEEEEQDLPVTISGPPEGLTLSFDPNVEDYQADGVVSKHNGEMMWHVGYPGNEVSIMILPDLWGWKGGRIRTFANFMAKALNAHVVIPRLLDRPPFEGGNDKDGLPADYPLQEKRADLKGWILKNTNEYYTSKVLNTINFIRHKGSKRVGVIGFGWGCWPLSFAAQGLTKEFVAGAMFHPQIKYYAEMNGENPDRLMQKICGPIMTITCGDADPKVYQPGGDMYEITNAQYPETCENVDFPDQPFAFAIQGDIDGEEKDNIRQRECVIEAFGAAARYMRRRMWPFPPGYDEAALRLACQKGETDTCEKLLKSGVAACGKEACDMVGQTPMFYCAREGFNGPLPLLIEWLADINKLGGVGLEAPLHVAATACRHKTCKMLLQYGADPNIRDKSNCAPFHKAARVGNVNCLKNLLAGKADIEARDTCEQTALHLAVIFSHDAAVEWLLKEGAETNVETIRAQTPLMIAERRELHKISALINAEDERREVEAFHRKAEEEARAAMMNRASISSAGGSSSGKRSSARASSAG